jgi:Coenzyme PQQ synthesis protein D (PqqD)
MNNSYPQARTADLVIRELPDEVLVYDLKTHQAHCLNQLAALIWQHCDGKSTVAQIAQRIEVEELTLLEEKNIWAALEQLSQNNLLVNSVKLPANVPGFSRRRAIRRIGLGAAAALPFVVSVVAPTAAQAATCPTGGNNQPVGCPCTGNGRCLSNCCDTQAGGGAKCLTSGLPGGAPCLDNCQCASNQCLNTGLCKV